VSVFRFQELVTRLPDTRNLYKLLPLWGHFLRALSRNKLRALSDFFKCDNPVHPVDPVKKLGLGSNIGHASFVGWVKHPDISCWVSFLNPTYLSAIFVLSAKPNKMAKHRAIPENCKFMPRIFTRLTNRAGKSQ